MDYKEKYIRIVSYDFKKETYYKITYGFINEIKEICKGKDSMLILKGNFLSKPIDENGKYMEGGMIEDICYVNKHYDCNRIVEKEEYEYFKSKLINEIKEYERKVNIEKQS